MSITTEPQKELKKAALNGLTAHEWALLSKNVIDDEDILNEVWSDIPTPARNKFQLEHGAVYPVKLAERLIKMYSKEGDTILDPFSGIGSTIIASLNSGRKAVGIELNQRFVDISTSWIQEEITQSSLNDNYKIFNDDCRNMTTLLSEGSIDLTVTSPPYADFIHKSVKDRKTVHKKSIIEIDNNSTVKPYSDNVLDFGNLPYSDFLVGIKDILHLNYKVSKKGAYAAWVVKDYRDTKNKVPYIPFHSDLAKVGQEVGWTFHDLVIWDQSKNRRLVVLGYPSVFYTNQNCSFIVIFRKL